jgi:hypothetical protein
VRLSVVAPTEIPECNEAYFVTFTAHSLLLAQKLGEAEHPQESLAIELSET